ncbi:ROK family glucokinase [Diplocloster modestus]|uniref:Glucokinase n=1 Tax=Diplocloster modestus TaxID=2850322 RepID=A0ABS6K6F0_9FIRM|nr:ROK family glucokinase [Diplocloster modestus]MBU9726026.1 ROK family glucokinase [Diplocloster modestus]
MDYYFGVDVGGTNIKLGMFSESGRMLENWEIPTRGRNYTEVGKNDIMQNIAGEILYILEERCISRTKVRGVGIGVPGPVLDNGYVESCVNLGLTDINPSLVLSELLGGIPVTVGNDANVAALGEMWRGGGIGYQSLVLVTLGTGVGSGVILDGKIVYGAKGLGGEIGHIMVNPNETDICNCGGRGCLDQMASATGIVRNAGKILKDTSLPSVLRGMEGFTARDVVDAAKAGDPAALVTLDYCMQFLGKCLAAVSYVVDPQVFVIGGGVSAAGDFLIRIIQEHYEKHAILKKEKAKIVLAVMGNDAGYYGAARMAMDKKEERHAFLARTDGIYCDTAAIHGSGSGTN